MEKITFYDIQSVADEMEDLYNDGVFMVGVVCKYDIARELIADLCMTNLNVGVINLYALEDYDKEYQVSVYDDAIHCTPLYATHDRGYDNEGYLFTSATIMYIHQDCNSKLLQCIEADEIYEIGIEEIDEIDDEEDTLPSGPSYINVKRTGDGTPQGFTKSWATSDDNGTFYSHTYSFYSEDLELLRDMAHECGVKL